MIELTSGSYNLINPASLLLDSGTNRYVVVFCGSADGADMVTSVTINGFTATPLGTATNTAVVSAWGYAIPDNLSGSITYVDNANARVEVMMFKGVDPVNPIKYTSGKYTNSALTISASALSVETGYVVTECVTAPVTSLINKYPTQVMLWSINQNCVANYTTPISGSIVMGFDYAVEGRSVMSIVSLNPMIEKKDLLTPMWLM